MAASKYKGENASCFKRLMACAIDNLIVQVPLIFFMWMYWADFSLENLFIIANSNFATYLSWFLPAIYEAVYLGTKKHATLGMQCVKLRLVSYSNKEVNVSRAFKRYIIAYLPFFIISLIAKYHNINYNFGFICYIPFLFIAFDKYNRGWYDYICKTIIVCDHRVRKKQRQLNIIAL
jgi:uncharacterized RDD family membrane protein YckC